LFFKQQSTLEGQVFDVVLLDEASQMTEPTSLVSSKGKGKEGVLEYACSSSSSSHTAKAA
jgi:superfamily I DNA and/or RNA helicase